MSRSQIPGGWATAEISEIGMQRTNTVDPSVYPDEVFELWSVPSFPTGLPEYLKGKEIGSTKQEVRPGDVLLCKINPRINRVWQVGPEGTHRQIASTEWIVVRGDRLDPSFLQLALRAPEFREILCANVSGVGGSLTRARPSQVAEYRLPIAPLNEQRRIVAKLEELSARSRRAREALEAVPPLLEQLRQSILAAAFSGRLTADWREENKDVEPASVLLERIRAERRRRWEDNELAKLCTKGKEPKDDRWKAKYKEPDPVDPTGLPELPGGWCWIQVGELCAIKHGFAFKSSGFGGSGAVVLTPGNFTPAGDLDFDSKRVVRTDDQVDDERILSNGDLLIVMTDLSPKKLILGSTVILESSETVLHNQRIGLVQPHSDEVSRAFIRLAMLEPSFKRHIDRTASGSLIQHTSPGRICSGLVALPPKPEQDQIVDVVMQSLATLRGRVGPQIEPIESLIHGLEQAVLTKAFRGELVPQDPSDEPASILLERIRAQRAAAESDTKKRKSSRSLRLRSQEEIRKDAKTAKNPTEDLQTVLHFLQTNPGPHSKQDILTNTNLDPTTWPTLALQLNNHPQIHRTGQKRSTRYEWGI